jgi:hypothetical protein
MCDLGTSTSARIEVAITITSSTKVGITGAC